jgi:hypothetical protein
MLSCKLLSTTAAFVLEPLWYEEQPNANARQLALALLKNKFQALSILLNSAKYNITRKRLFLFPCLKILLVHSNRWTVCNQFVFFRGRCARMGNTLKLPSPTKLAQLGNFPPASHAGRLAGPVFYVNVFSLAETFSLFPLSSSIL